jgi:tetratricopeptide (TPR) repeat protein
MSDKKIKSLDEWKEVIGKLSPLDFEHLCYQLVKSMSGFSCVDLRDGSSDSGRDIDAIYRSKAPDGITEITEKWRFECKRYSDGISFNIISGKINQSSANRIDKLVIMSNMHLTPQCKDEIEKTQGSFFCKILDWTGVHFQDILFQFPHVCQEFFPDEEIPQRQIETKESKKLIEITERAGSNFGIKLKLELKNGQRPPKNVEEATDFVKSALLNINNVDINIKCLMYHQMSGLFLSINRMDDSLLFIDESLKITPNNTPALLQKGYILGKMEKLNKSNKCYDKILEIDEFNKFALNNKAHNLLRSWELEKALILIIKALEVDPKYVLAINNKVAILSALERNDEALEYLNRVLAEHKDSRILMLSKINILIKLLDLKEAMKLNNRLLELDSNDVDAINNKGVIYEHNAAFQNPEKYMPMAIRYFDEAVAKNNNYSVGWSNKIVCLINSNLTKDAEEIINQIVDIFPNDPHLLREQGRFFMAKNDYKKAIGYFNRSLKNNFNKNVAINKCWALYKLHKYDEIIRIIDGKILKYDYTNLDAWNLKGETLKKLHQIVKANYCFKKSKENTIFPRSLLE